MIDIHCHILPGLDDGAKTLVDSLMMAKAAVRQGIDTIIATPHHNHTYVNSRNNIIDMVDYLNENITDHCIPLTILPGQDTWLHDDMMDQLKDGKILPLNECSNYILIELCKQNLSENTLSLLYDLQNAGFQPIISAPELNPVLMKNQNLLYAMVKSGALTQITGASILGKHGLEIQNFANAILETNQCHFLGSNAHNLTDKGFYLQAAIKCIKKYHGDKLAMTLMENSKSLISGKQIIKEDPITFKRQEQLHLI